MGNNTSTASRHGGNGASTFAIPPPASTLGPDGGHLVPLSGTYANQPQEWDKAVVYRLITTRAIAPFYRGLQDEWDDAGDDRPGLDRLLDAAGKVAAKAPAPVAPGQDPEEVPLIPVDRSREPERHREAEAQAYERGTAECPICFLNFPSNMNYSRCCEQPICSECFVQIKRVDPTTTNLTSEPVACPYCVEPEFGVTYRPPAVMNRREPDGSPAKIGRSSPPGGRPDSSPLPPTEDLSELSISPTSGRRKSVSASAAGVVTVDHVHPNWQAKLEAVRATAARRANRRIVFRRVGDRLIPVGITSSRDVLAAAAAAEANMAAGGSTPPGGASGGDGEGIRSFARRSRRRGSGREPEVQQYLSGLAGQDLEELMIMEAMRLSMLEQEERERKEKAEREKADREGGTAPGGPIASTSTARTSPPPVPNREATPVPFTSTANALPPPLLPTPASPLRRSLPPGGVPGVSLLTATAPSPAVVSPTSAAASAQTHERSDPTSYLVRHQSEAPSFASTEASSVELDPGYQRLEDDDD